MSESKSILKSPWLVPCLVAVGIIIVTKGRIFAALIPLARFILPALGIYFIYRYVKSRMQIRMQNVGKSFFEELQKQQQRQTQRGAGDFGRDQGTVIDICPQCGAPKTSACDRHPRKSP